MKALTPVHGSPAPERLEDQQYVVLLLRLLVHRDGHIVHGDAGGAETDASTVERWVHFHGPGGLLEAVQGWLADHGHGPTCTPAANLLEERTDHETP